MNPEEVEKRLAEYDAAKLKKKERIAYLHDLIPDEEIDIDMPPGRDIGYLNSFPPDGWANLSDETKIRLCRRYIDVEGRPPHLIRDTESWKKIQEEKREELKTTLGQRVEGGCCFTGAASPLSLATISERKYIGWEKPRSNVIQTVVEALPLVSLWSGVVYFSYNFIKFL